MCYSYALNPDEESLALELRIGINKPYRSPNFELLESDPYFYVSGFDHPVMPVIFNDPEHGISWSKMRWGLLTKWSQAPAFHILNSRDDSVFTKSIYNDQQTETRWDILERRCLIPMTGFYDSHTVRPSEKYPFYFRLIQRELFFVGGIWRQLTDPRTGAVSRSFSMITTTPNEKVRLVHNHAQRMINILPKGYEEYWLAKGLSEAEIKTLIKPYPDNDMYCHPIHKRFNNYRTERNVPEAFDEALEYKLVLSDLLQKIDTHS